MEDLKLRKFQKKFGLRKIFELSKLRKIHEGSELMMKFSKFQKSFVWTLKIFQLSLDLVTIEDWTLKIFN